MLLLLSSITSPLLAQDAPPPPQQPLYTLHLDTRMAQIPTLMLNFGSKSLPLFGPQRIDITVDNGHKFHPAHVRFEGGDPITLAILFDVSHKDPALLNSFRNDFSGWIKTSLKPQDRVSIYALDCSLLQTAEYQPPTPAILQSDLDTAITSPLSHGIKGRPACGDSVRLRGAMNYIMQQLAPLPGRHVLLVLSSGFDGGSTLSWDDLHDIATGTATTIFAIDSQSMGFYAVALPLDALTRESGGLFLRTTTKHLAQTLTGFISILRQREILEFPLPSEVFGNHIIDVTVERSNVQALPSGIPIVPIPEAPATVPVSPQSTPPTPQP
ncbi:MAG: hypothetical protein WBY53_09685 [Acidobacteriaceae bacterium]